MKNKLKYISILLISGCMVGPDYKKPDISLPKNFIEDRSKLEITSIKEWWKNFNNQTLNDIIEIAISNNYDLKIALEKIEETRAYYRIKKADLLPEIDGTASAIRYHLSKNAIESSAFPSSSYNSFQIGFDALWEIDIFGKLRREKESAFYEIQAMQENMRNIYIIMISDIARYHIDICAINNFIDLTKEKIYIQKTILDLIKDRNIKGIDNKIKVEETIAKLQEEEENLLFYITLLKQTIYRLSVLLGKQPEDVVNIFTNIKNIPEYKNEISAGLPSTLIRRRPDIKKAERELAAATAQIGAAIAEYFPLFSLTNNTSLKSNKISKLLKNKSLNWSLGSLMNWPIITFGRIRANVDIKKSKQKQALLFYENTILQALKEVESALVAYFNEKTKLIYVQKELFSIKIKTDLEKDKLINGISDLPYFLENKLIYIEKKIKEIESKRNLNINLISLFKTLGGEDW
ncbi:MAG: hypothetical protein AMS24_01475 [Chlamydiae bacterium SM23_39]|nr:MAG: hypothetical protein AMS24_01475 [Chlamydiae bacterium SM23_39]